MTLRAARDWIRLDTIATAGAYLLQGALAALIFSVYQGTDRELLDTSSSRVRLLAYASVAGVGLALVLLVVVFRWSRSDRRSQFWFPVVAGFIFGIGTLAVLEVGIRLIAKPDPLGQRVGSTILLPYDWRRLSEFNNEILGRSRLKSAYYVEHDRLGWAIGPNRTGENGLYASSAEGLRSNRPGIALAETPASNRVALLGDSFAFSQEVSYDDSLGTLLEQKLPSDTQVLNFGVPGYGLDQAVLRYEIEAVDWGPSVAILTFINDDLNRSVNVYTFLKVGWELPLSKPRFVVDGEGTTLLNSPTLNPDDIFARRSIFDLPLLEYESEFFARQWETHPLHASYVFRYLVSRVPVWPVASAHTSPDAIVALGSALIRRFVESTRAARTVPLVVYLPGRGDFRGDDRTLKGGVIADLENEDFEVVDLTSCVANIPPSELFVTGGVHYTGTGNDAVALCLKPLIERALVEFPK